MQTCSNCLGLTPPILCINHLWMKVKYLNKVVNRYCFVDHLVYMCFCVLGFLTTLLLSLPQLASLQRATVNVGTQADVSVGESMATGRKYFVILNNCLCELYAESSHHAHLSLEQHILAFEKECEERNQRTMEEKVYKLNIVCFLCMM